jgi:type IX secretion system PorP/SprF family membrane protein
MKKFIHKKLIALALLLLAGSGTKLMAQYDPMFTQYMFNEMFINPAYAGSKEALAISALHRQQWVGFEGRPVTTTLSLHGPLANNKMGIGLSILNESLADGKLKRNLVYATYAYRIKTGNTGHLSFGLMGGAHIQSNNYASLQTTDLNDVRFSANTGSVLTPNFGAGIYYATKKFYAGFSIPRMVADNLSIGTGGDVVKNTKVDPTKFHYYFTMGRVFNAGTDLKLKPQIMLKAVQNAPVELDLNLNALIMEKLWLGASYRTKADMSFIAGLQVNPQFLISYSYDYTLSKIRDFSSGSHEIGLGYIFGFKGKKIISNRYF